LIVMTGASRAGLLYPLIDDLPWVTGY